MTLVVGQGGGGARHWIGNQTEGLVRRMAGRQSDSAPGGDVRYDRHSSDR